MKQRHLLPFTISALIVGAAVVSPSDIAAKKKKKVDLAKMELTKSGGGK